MSVRRVFLHDGRNDKIRPRGYAVRVPGPDDLWTVHQDGGELGVGTVAGYSSDDLRTLIVLLTDALADVERAETIMDQRKEPHPR